MGTASDADERDRDEWVGWATCYILADFLRDSDFADTLIGVAFEIIQANGRTSHMAGTTIYDYSCKGSPHRKFAVRATARWAEIPQIEELVRGPHSCEELAVDVLVALVLA
jgi:hypothetical protein